MDHHLDGLAVRSSILEELGYTVVMD
jgi:hypothetical protein